jgi:hypothetical protein
VTGYRPMTLVDLAGGLVRTAESKTRWKLVWEFLEEYRWEPEGQGPGGRVREADSVLFGRAELERAFTALGERLVRRRVVADISIVGGAAGPGLRRCPRHPRCRCDVQAVWNRPRRGHAGREEPRTPPFRVTRKVLCAGQVACFR